ncbi:shikimate kinase AroK [Pseudomonadota bacterium]
MQQNIILVGPMGVGKTTIGRPLANKLDMEFVDSDREIEHRTGVTISIIFEIEGEDGFRKRESAMIDELTQRKNTVLATGGGAILDDFNRMLMRKRGVVVYLHASVDLQLSRTRTGKNRPLLMNGDPRKTLEDLMAVREPLYRQEADIVVNTENRSPGAVAREIAERVVEL